MARRHQASGDPRLEYLREFRDNLEAGMRYYEPLLSEVGDSGENIGSLAREIQAQSLRVSELWLEIREKIGVEAPVAPI